MPRILVTLIWLATAFNTLSTFYGFELALGATTLRGDIVCLFGALLVITMALSSAYILKKDGLIGGVFKSIWGISLLFGVVCALQGNFSAFPPDNIPGDASETNFWTMIVHEAGTMKGILVIFLTLICAFLSTMHSTMPESAQIKFRFYKSK